MSTLGQLHLSGGDSLPEDSGFLDGTNYSITEDVVEEAGPHDPDYGTMERICTCPRPVFIRKSLPYHSPEERKGPCNMAPTYCDQCMGLRAGPAEDPLCQAGRSAMQRKCAECDGKGVISYDIDGVTDDIKGLEIDTVAKIESIDQAVTPDRRPDQRRCDHCLGRGVAVVIGPDGSPISPLSHTFSETTVRRLQAPYNVTMPAMADEERRFCTYKVEYIMKDIFERKLKHVRYDPATCSRLSHDLCTMIKDKTKTMEFERYKLVVQVILGQDTEDSVQVASRCLWDQDTDNFAAATFRNSNLYAVGIVYGMHLD